MAIFKIIKSEKYAQISNDLLNDPTLSLRAKGLLCYLISKPVTWSPNVEHLYKVCKEGKDAIYSTINELIDAGYIVRVQLKNNQGRHCGVDYHVHEIPLREKPDTENPCVEKPDNSNTEDSINTELIKGPVKPAANNSYKEELSIRQRKIQFLKRIIDWIQDNQSKYPKLMFVDFAKYWVESSVLIKKQKLRFEEQRFFDIGRRLSTWFQKAKHEIISEYWKKEEELPTINELFKKQIL